MQFLDVLVPLVPGLLLLFKPEIFFKNANEENQKKKSKILGFLLIGASVIFFISKIL